MRFKSTSFYHWAPPVRTVWSQFGSQGFEIFLFWNFPEISFFCAKKGILILRFFRPFKLTRSIFLLCILSVLLMKKSENLLLDSLVLLMYPPLVPRLLPVQDQQEVLKLRKTKLLPLYLARIILLNIDNGLQVILRISPNLKNKLPALASPCSAPQHRQHQGLLILLQSPQSQSGQGLTSRKTERKLQFLFGEKSSHLSPL